MREGGVEDLAASRGAPRDVGHRPCVTRGRFPTLHRDSVTVRRISQHHPSLTFILLLRTLVLFTFFSLLPFSLLARRSGSVADGTNSSFYDDDEDEDEAVHRYGLGAAGDLSVRARHAEQRRRRVPISRVPVFFLVEGAALIFPTTTNRMRTRRRTRRTKRARLRA